MSAAERSHWLGEPLAFRGMKSRSQIPFVLVIVLAMLVLVTLESVGVDVPDWLLYVAFGAGAGIYLVRSNRAPQPH